jgi:hypothetical protein
MRKLQLIFIFAVVTACAHQEVLKVNVAQAPKIKVPVSMKLVGVVGREEISSNCSVSVSKSFSSDQILHKRVETVDFKTRMLTKTILENSGNLIQILNIISKKGTSSLHDLAYPELGEEIEFEFTPSAVVKHAGMYPKSSLFFVPPLPLPSRAVRENDNWELKSGWISEVGGLPLNLVMHAKFIDQKPCGEHMCMNIGVEGVVHLRADIEKKNGFGHAVSGRFLFEPVAGLLSWSEFVSDEHLQTEGAQAEVHSVLRSELVSPQGYRTVSREEPACPLEKVGE